MNFSSSSYVSHGETFSLEWCRVFDISIARHTTILITTGWLAPPFPLFLYKQSMYTHVCMCINSGWKLMMKKHWWQWLEKWWTSGCWSLNQNNLTQTDASRQDEEMCRLNNRKLNQYWKGRDDGKEERKETPMITSYDCLRACVDACSRRFDHEERNERSRKDSSRCVQSVWKCQEKHCPMMNRLLASTMKGYCRRREGCNRFFCRWSIIWC